MPSRETSLPDNYADDAVAMKVKAMQDEELLTFIRGTVSRLDALADRLERLADEAEPPTKEINSA